MKWGGWKKLTTPQYTGGPILIIPRSDIRLFWGPPRSDITIILRPPRLDFFLRGADTPASNFSNGIALTIYTSKPLRNKTQLLSHICSCWRIFFQKLRTLHDYSSIPTSKYKVVQVGCPKFCLCTILACAEISCRKSKFLMTFCVVSDINLKLNWMTNNLSNHSVVHRNKHAKSQTKFKSTQ